MSEPLPLTYGTSVGCLDDLAGLPTTVAPLHNRVRRLNHDLATLMTCLDEPGARIVGLGALWNAIDEEPE